MVIKEGNIIQLELPENCNKLFSQDIYVYQHDKGQILEFINVIEGTQVEFGNKNHEKAEIYNIENGRVQIPDFLITESETITAYVRVINENSETTIKEVAILVKEKPDTNTGIAPENQQTFAEQIIGSANEAKSLAQSVRDDADNGVFNGKDGEDYILTDEDKREIAHIVEKILDLFKIVSELPETGEENKIYFVPKQDSESNDLFEEFVWKNNDWEYIGTKRINYDDSALRNLINEKADKEKVVDLTSEQTVTGKKIIRTLTGTNIDAMYGSYYELRVVNTPEDTVQGKSGVVSVKYADNKYAQIEYVDRKLEQLELAKVVNELPEQGEENIIYLVPVSDPDNDNLYDEYLWKNGWERVGSGKIDVDLSNYATKVYVDETVYGSINFVLEAIVGTIDESEVQVNG